MKRKSSYDYYLIVATAVVLFVISAVCIYGMFYFKFAQLQQMPPQLKTAYMERMNTVMAPFIIALILLLGICVPKRILPLLWLNRFGVLLLALAAGVAAFKGVAAALLAVLAIAALLQALVLALALAGNEQLYFEKKGYWLRVGSSAIHLGLIMFILDLFLYRYQTLHLFLFWVTTGATTLGMMSCFYAEPWANWLKAKGEN